MKKYFQASFIVGCISLSMTPLYAQWSQTDSTKSFAVLSLAATADGSKVFAGTSGAGIFYSADNGTHFTGIDSMLAGSSVRAIAVSGVNIFVGTDKGIFHTPLASIGSTSWQGWTENNSGVNDKNILSLAVSADGTKLFAGTSTGAYLSSNNGTSWTAVNNGLTNTYVNALAVLGTTLFAATLGGVFFSSTGGAFWTSVNSGLTNTNVYTVAVSGATIFVGTDDGVFRSSNNGASWSAANTGLTTTDVNCLLVSGQTIYLGTFSGGVFLSTDNGANWRSVNIGLKNTFVNALAVNGRFLFAGSSGVWNRPTTEMVTSVGNATTNVPIRFALDQNYPNPFNPSTTISFSLPARSFASLKVFDALGREVAVVFSDEMDAGTYSRQWNAAGYPSGMYFYQLRAGSFVETKRLLLLK